MEHHSLHGLSVITWLLCMNPALPQPMQVAHIGKTILG